MRSCFLVYSVVAGASPVASPSDNSKNAPSKISRGTTRIWHVLLRDSTNAGQVRTQCVRGSTNNAKLWPKWIEPRNIWQSGVGQHVCVCVERQGCLHSRLTHRRGDMRCACEAASFAQMRMPPNNKAGSGRGESERLPLGPASRETERCRPPCSCSTQINS